jgi:hypothetical protein
VHEAVSAQPPTLLRLVGSLGHCRCASVLKSSGVVCPA